MSGTRDVPKLKARMSFVTTPTMVEKIQQAARQGMTSSGQWLRAAALDRLRKESKLRATRPSAS
jgi:hypothetical protein